MFKIFREGEGLGTGPISGKMLTDKHFTEEGVRNYQGEVCSWRGLGMRPSGQGAVATGPNSHLAGEVPGKWILLIMMASFLLLGGCSTSPDHQKLTILNNSPSLKVAEVPATATTGRNYQYCYGCIVYNYRDFETYHANTLQSIGQIIAKQIAAQAADRPPFNTDINFVPVNPSAPDYQNQFFTLMIPGGQ